jgi:hypothetical protein
VIRVPDDGLAKHHRRIDLDSLGRQRHTDTLK